MLTTDGSKHESDNISSVFGSKFFTTLMPINLQFGSLPMEEEIVVSDDESIFSSIRDVNENTTADVLLQSVNVAGFISRVGLGVGRSDNDRQFLYCNGRPVDIPRFVKALNEVKIVAPCKFFD